MGDLKYKYKQYESPEERLRNKLQPFWFLVDMAMMSQDEDLKKSAKMCQKVMDDVHTLLSDIETFYTNPMRIAPGLTYRHLGKLDYNDKEQTLYSLHSSNLAFIDDDETPTIYKSIIGRDGIMEMQIISGDDGWWKEPHLAVFEHRFSEKKKKEGNYYWDNHHYLKALGEALIDDKETEEVQDFREFCEEHEVRFTEMAREYVWLYKKSVIYNFW